MPFVVTESCIRCKFTDCVDVCPAECFYEGATMLVIHPDECIDCGLCEPECPVAAILPDSYSESEPWIAINRDLSLVWPKILQGHDPLPDANEFTKLTGKYDKYFSPEPASAAG